MSSTRKRIDKYELYEAAVQSPDVHIDFFYQAYQDLNGSLPRTLREDFCGTYLISTEWVRFHGRNSAICLDLDPEPLAYGTARAKRILDPDQRRRLHILRQNVISRTQPKVDVLTACNFSFNIFKEWDTLVAYFKAARASIHRQGIFILEGAGGPGMIEEIREKTVHKKGRKRWFTYIWDQKSFDPITHEALYSIHFELPGGKKLKDSFVYDWRLWTIPELRKALEEAGFSSIHTYWEKSNSKGEGTCEYYKAKTAPNEHAFIYYLVAQP